MRVWKLGWLGFKLSTLIGAQSDGGNAKKDSIPQTAKDACYSSFCGSEAQEPSSAILRAPPFPHVYVDFPMPLCLDSAARQGQGHSGG